MVAAALTATAPAVPVPQQVPAARAPVLPVRQAPAVPVRRQALAVPVPVLPVRQALAETALLPA